MSNQGSRTELVAPARGHLPDPWADRCLYDEAWGPPAPTTRRPVTGEWDDPTFVAVEADDRRMIAENVRALHLLMTANRATRPMPPSHDTVWAILDALAAGPVTATMLAQASGGSTSRVRDTLQLLTALRIVDRDDTRPLRYWLADPAGIEWDIEVAPERWDAELEARREARQQARRDRLERRKADRAKEREARRRRAIETLALKRQQAEDERQRNRREAQEREQRLRDAWAAQSASHAEAVLAAVARLEPATPEDLAVAAGLTSDQLKRTLRALVAEDRVRRDRESGRYRRPTTPSLAQQRLAATRALTRAATRAAAETARRERAAAALRRSREQAEAKAQEQAAKSQAAATRRQDWDEAVAAAPGTREAILALVARGAHTTGEILEALGNPQRSPTPILMALCQTGALVTRKEGGRYRYHLGTEATPPPPPAPRKRPPRPAADPIVRLLNFPKDRPPEPTPADHEAARRRAAGISGLSPNRRAVLNALTTTAQTRADIARTAGVSQRVATNVLNLLAQEGRAVTEGNRHRLPVPIPEPVSDAAAGR